MKTIELIANVDAQHRLSVEVPADVMPGPVKIILALPTDAEEEDGWSDRELTDDEWRQIIAYSLRDELNDPREDVYTESDGEPVHG